MRSWKSGPACLLASCQVTLSAIVQRIAQEGSDWIRLVFAHPFPLNSRAPIALGNFISDGKVQVSPHLAIPTNGGSVIQDQRVGTIQLLFQSDPFLHKPIVYGTELQLSGTETLYTVDKDTEPDSCRLQVCSFKIGGLSDTDSGMIKMFYTPPQKKGFLVFS